MNRRISFTKQVVKALAVIAIAIASFSTFSINAQDAAYSQDIAVYPEFSEQSCYTQNTIDCGLNLGEQIVCSFNGVYGKPYICEEYSCYGTRSRRECVLKTRS